MAEAFKDFSYFMWLSHRPFSVVYYVCVLADRQTHPRSFEHQTCLYIYFLCWLSAIFPDTSMCDYLTGLLLKRQVAAAEGISVGLEDLTDSVCAIWMILNSKCTSTLIQHRSYTMWTSISYSKSDWRLRSVCTNYRALIMVFVYCSWSSWIFAGNKHSICALKAETWEVDSDDDPLNVWSCVQNYCYNNYLKQISHLCITEWLYVRWSTIHWVLLMVMMMMIVRWFDYTYSSSLSQWMFLMMREIM